MYPQKKQQTNLVDLLMQEQDKNIVPAVNMQPQQMPMPQNNRFKDALFGTGGDIGRALLSGQGFGQALGAGSLGLQQRRQQGEQDVLYRQLLGQTGINVDIPQNTMVTPDIMQNVVKMQTLQNQAESTKALNEHRRAQVEAMMRSGNAMFGDSNNAFLKALEFANTPEQFNTLNPELQSTLGSWLQNQSKDPNTLYNQQFATQHGKGMGTLPTAQPIEYQKGLGKQQSELEYAGPIAQQKALGSGLMQQTPQGEIQAIPGSPEARRVEEYNKGLEFEKQMTTEYSSVALGEINKSLAVVSNTLGAKGDIARMLPFIRSEHKDFEGWIDSLKGTSGITSLLNFKKQNGTLGHVPQSQFEMLASLKGSLSMKLSPTAMRDNLMRQKIIYTALMEERPFSQEELQFFQFDPSVMKNYYESVERDKQQGQQLPPPPQGQPDNNQGWQQVGEFRIRVKGQ